MEMSLVFQAGLLLLILSGIPLAAAAVTGLVVSVFQAATQIQEQSIGYISKVCAIGVTLVLLAEWMTSELRQLFVAIFSELTRISLR